MKARTPSTTRRTHGPSATAGGRIGEIVHDLNNIFAPILMAASLLKPRAAEPTSARLVALVAEHARRGVGLVRELEAFGRDGGPGPGARPRGGGRRR